MLFSTPEFELMLFIANVNHKYCRYNMDITQTDESSNQNQWGQFKGWLGALVVEIGGTLVSDVIECMICNNKTEFTREKPD